MYDGCNKDNVPDICFYKAVYAIADTAQSNSFVFMFK